MGIPVDSTLETWLEASVEHVQRVKRAKRLGGKKMSANLAVIDPGSMLERVVVHGDLSKLAPGDRAVYYGQVCSSLGLNPLTRPFEYLTLNGKQILYARRDCTDQLRKIHGVSVTIQAREHIGELMVVTARATLPNGRTDESTGAVSIGKLQGEALANAMMKAETKAKRRVTLSICGLAVLDESEIEGAQAADQRTTHSPAEMPGDDPAPRQNDTYDRCMATLADIEKRLKDTRAITYQELLEIRERMGKRGGPQVQMVKDMSELNRGDDISPSQKKELGKVWNRIDRQVTRFEGITQAPPVEASFDEPESEREPGDDTEL